MSPPRDPNVPRDEFDTQTPTAVREFRYLEARVQRLEMRDAAMHGLDGQDGAWGRYQAEHQAMMVDVGDLKGKMSKIMLIMSAGGVIFGVVAGVVAHLIEKAL